jgi:hypothetical protein
VGVDHDHVEFCFSSGGGYALRLEDWLVLVLALFAADNEETILLIRSIESDLKFCYFLPIIITLLTANDGDCATIARFETRGYLPSHFLISNTDKFSQLKLE